MHAVTLPDKPYANDCLVEVNPQRFEDRLGIPSEVALMSVLVSFTSAMNTALTYGERLQYYFTLPDSNSKPGGPPTRTVISSSCMQDSYVCRLQPFCPYQLP
jgi:hypothetical protein